MPLLAPLFRRLAAPSSCYAVAHVCHRARSRWPGPLPPPSPHVVTPSRRRWSDASPGASPSAAPDAPSQSAGRTVQKAPCACASSKKEKSTVREKSRSDAPPHAPATARTTAEQRQNSGRTEKRGRIVAESWQTRVGFRGRPAAERWENPGRIVADENGGTAYRGRPAAELGEPRSAGGACAHSYPTVLSAHIAVRGGMASGCAHIFYSAPKSDMGSNC